MKKLVWFILGCLILFIGGCKAGEEDAKKEPPREFETTFWEYFIPQDIKGNVNIMDVTEDSMYLWEGSHEYHFFYKVYLGEKPVTEKLPIAFRGNQWPDGFMVGKQGDIFLTYWEEEGEEVRFYLADYASDNSLKWVSELTKSLPEKKEGPSIKNNICQDADGRIYISGRGYVLACEKNGEPIGSFELPFEEPWKMAANKDGRVFILSEGETRSGDYVTVFKLAELFLDSLSCGEVMEITGDLLVPDEKGGLCYFDKDWTKKGEEAGKLLEVDVDTGISEEVLRPGDYQIEPMGIWEYCMDGKRKIFAMWEEQNNAKPIEILCLTRREGEQDEAKEPEKLLLVSDQISAELSYKVKAFNRRNKNYQIQVEQLEETEFPSRQDMLARINAMLLSGKVDLVFLSEEDYCRYKGTNVFLELNDRLRESCVRVEDYLPNLVEAYMEGEKIYTLPTKFEMNGYALKKSLTGDEGPATMEDFLNCLEQHPNLKLRWGGGKMWAFETCMQYGWKRFVNLEEGTCSFDSAEFRKLIGRINTLNLDYSLYDSSWDRCVAEGEAVIQELYLNRLIQFAAAEDYLGEEITWFGYPGPGKEAQVRIMPERFMCIAQNSENQDGAFAFWEYYIKSTEQDRGGLSAKTDVFHKQMETVCTRQFYENEFGEIVEGAVDYCGGFEKFGEIRGYPALSDSRRQFLENAVMHLCPDSTEGVNIRDMIIAEMMPYFMGQKNLEEATDLLQNRVQLYLNE